MKQITYATLFCAFALVFNSCGKKAETDSKEVAEETNEAKFDDSNIEKDTEFATDVADASMLEVKLGELAVSQGTLADVKTFAQTMIDDHKKANEELMAAAQAKNITLPASLSEKSQKTYDDLAGKKGLDFDKAYADQMVDDHKKVVEKFKDEAEKGNDADLKAWAAGKVAALEHHLQMAETLKETVKNAK